MIPRYLIDDIFRAIVNNDYEDKWNFPVFAAKNFLDFLKTGEGITKNSNILRNHKFYSYNNITLCEIQDLLLPLFIENKNEIIENFIEGFFEFIKNLKYQIQTNHAKFIYSDGNYREDSGRQIISAAVFGYFQNNGFVYHEVPSGVGFLDILICNDREIIIEVKLHRNFNPRSEQLQNYLKIGNNRKGFYFVFDTTKSFTHKKYCDIENNRFSSQNKINIIVCHINQKIPSKT